MLKTYIKESLKYHLRSYPIIKSYIREIDSLYDMSQEQLKKRNDKIFLSILHKAYQRSPFYNKLYKDSKIDISRINGIDDIQRLPIITKEMIRLHHREMLTSSSWKMLNNHTSGTSGSHLDVWESWDSIFREQAAHYCYRKRCGYTYGKDVMASLRGNLSHKEYSLWIHCSKTLFLSSYNVRPETTRHYVDAIHERKPKAIEGYPSSLYALACNIEEMGYEICIPLCFTSSETLLDWMRTKIENVFHTKIYDTYGMTERTIQAFESFDHNGYFESPGYGVYEYGDEGTVTTSLINDSFPLIRYQIDDILELKDKDDISLAWGQIPSNIRRIKGRAMQYIQGKDGSLYSTASLTFIVKDCSSIKYSQFVQYEDEHVDLCVVPLSQELPESERSHIMKVVDSTIGLKNMDFSITLIKEEDLILSPSGKFCYVVNKKNLFHNQSSNNNL